MKNICLFRLLIFVATLLLSQLANPAKLISAENYEIKGVVFDAKDKSAIPFAAIYIHEIALGVTADGDGSFNISTKYTGTLKFTISSIGYQTLDIDIKIPAKNDLIIELKPASYSLSEVVVQSKEGDRGNSVSLIEKTAMQHIQPSSFADVLQLLPGHSSSETKMNTANFVTMRQAGTDNNTSLGTSFIINGSIVNNDANLQSYYGLTDDRLSNRTTTSKGVDMRTISTDKIESVEVIRGIPSAKYGDVTAGVINIELKSGYTPWEGRAKVDLKNQLFSVGKGLILPNIGGALNVDVDYAAYNPNPRNDLENYTRVTFASRYENTFKLSSSANLLLRGSFSYTGSFDDVKNDAQALNNGYLKTDYDNYAMSLQGTLKLKKTFIKEAKYAMSYNVTKDNMERYNLVTLSGATPLPATSLVEGIFDSGFLPPEEYYSKLNVEGKPVSLNTSLDLKSELRIGNTFHSFSYGTSFSYAKNKGKGQIYDSAHPPYISLKSIRPRAFSDIPAIQKLSFYLEDNINWKFGESKLALQPGIRFTSMVGMDKKYEMQGKWYAEPRANMKFTFPQFQIAGNNSSFAITGGIGQLYRFPTMSQLYPDKIYFDYVQLNYYPENEDYRYTNIKTYISDPTNYALEPAKNTKYEIGFVFVTGNIKLDVTFFKESMDNGFSTGQTSVSHTYTYYEAGSVQNPTSRPTLDQFTYTNEYITSLYSRNINDAGVYKKGIEYTLDLGKISAIYTRIWLNGAWFRTHYTYNALQYKKPTGTMQYLDPTLNEYVTRPYKYIGIYEYSDDAKVRSQFNTNIYLDTHIPFLRMIFTTSIQNMWFETARRDYNIGMPSYYLDEYGNKYQFTDTQLNDANFIQLIDTQKSSYKFKTDRTAMATKVNLKLSKEIGDNIRLACYLNNVLTYLPDYTSYTGTRVTNRSNGTDADPYFGAELNIKF